MLLYISAAYAATIQYEFYYDAQVPNLIDQQPKVNIDKVRYEWGGCIYAGWCISSLEILSSGLIFHFRGFKQERETKQNLKTKNDDEYEVLIRTLDGKIPRAQFKQLHAYAWLQLSVEQM